MIVTMWKVSAVIFCIITYIQCVKFGEDNSYTCHCNNDEQCDTVNGDCSGGCASGWFGVSCQKQNVALGKPTSQVNFKVGKESGLAVDGDTTTNITNKCIDTNLGDYTRWWRVDLQEEYPIKNITIYYRSEPDWSLVSLHGFSLHVTKENEETKLCYKDNTNNIGVINNIECSQVITGRYVNISNFHTRRDSRFLVLCEVEIFVCSIGTFGSDCTNFCHCLNNERCSETGECPGSRCAVGWTGRTCSQTCDNDMYGAGCSKLCSERKCLVEISPCNHINGSCQGRCKEGLTGIDCVKRCEEGVYGAECSKKCSERNCLVETSPCNHINGSCQGDCKEGFIGIDCVKRCEEGDYGAGCSKKCSDRKCKDSNLQCDSKTGECIDGCQPGYQSIDCIQECDNGTYGQDCQFNCSARFCQPQDKDNCSNIDGACDCLEGYHSIDCVAKQQATEPRNEDPGNQDTIIIAAVVSGCVIIIIIVVIITLIIRRRRSPPPVDDVTSDKSVARNIAVVKPQVQGLVYENSDVIREESTSRVAVEPTRNVYQNQHSQPLESLQPLEVQESEAASEIATEPKAETTSMTEEIGISPYLMPEKSDFNLTELEEFLKKTKPNDGFDPLYKGLLNDFASSYDISQIPENRKKNRFKGYYPYDDTRVVLDKLDDDPHSDYINANFLKGYDGNLFIAAQGATRVTQNDFVRMIWDMNCDKVVMVTKEFEDVKRKCERYWPPEVGSSETFGLIKLTLKEEIYRENYTRRCIIMERDQMEHLFYHFHYISWPDHGVPETNDMLDFQFTVNKFKPESQSPVLVHCSAGVGRTGTYIAIDYCLKQYNDIGKVDVLECVKILRQQRKGMIQTPAQLQFVHEALIEGIKRGDTAMNKNTFESEYDKHASKIRIGNSSLKQQLLHLKTVENNRELTAQHKYIVSDSTQLYRYPSHTQEFGIYFEELRNVEPNDIWKGIFETNATLAIFILDNTHSAVCPAKGSTETRGDFVIENKSEEKISSTLNVNSVELETKGHSVLSVNVLISRMDKSSIKKPTDLYKHMLDIIENMVIYRNDLKPFFIISSDIQYSRIFCILHNIVQRIKLDNEVELFKAFCKMHRLIGKIIISQEEYNVLHAIVAEYVKSKNTYANL